MSFFSVFLRVAEIPNAQKVFLKKVFFPPSSEIKRKMGPEKVFVQGILKSNI